ncbi:MULTISPECIES: hypothetical protein [unclassified Pseudomonas]|uniref:hypothetical protein n=1 Tax=unclassified Pseudomonas TaxID=196821 RepID=UPI0028D8CEF8|nr:hypothetical protein [uncultured Pseudomonas sp.]
MTDLNVPPLQNFTPLGVRYKRTSLAQTSPSETFAQALKKTTHKKEIPHHERTDTRVGLLKQEIMAETENDSKKAALLAEVYAYRSLTCEVVDLFDYPVIRYWATGEIVTSESKAYFQETWSRMQIKRTDLYQAELSKGTPAVKILEKILSFNDALPQKFRDITNW